MTLALNVPPQLLRRLRNRAAREGVSTDAYAIVALRQGLDDKPAPRKAPHGASLRESQLLKKVHVGIAQDFWDRYHDLKAKRDAETLTPAEWRELVRISNRIELAHARRMKYVAQLAGLRGIPLEKLMKQLGIGNGRDIPKRRPRRG